MRALEGRKSSKSLLQPKSLYNILSEEEISFLNCKTEKYELVIKPAPFLPGWKDWSFGADVLRGEYPQVAHIVHPSNSTSSDLPWSSWLLVGLIIGSVNTSRRRWSPVPTGCLVQVWPCNWRNVFSKVTISCRVNETSKKHLMVSS